MTNKVVLTIFKHICTYGMYVYKDVHESKGFY